MKSYALLGLLLTFGAFASPDYLSVKEKVFACQAMINHQNYERGNSVDRCVDGEWSVRDVLETAGKRTVVFKWIGRLSNFHTFSDECTAIVVSQRSSQTMSLRDLDCK